MKLVKIVVRDNAVGYTPLYLIYEDIAQQAGEFNAYNISHVKRVGNYVAHLVARWGGKS